MLPRKMKWTQECLINEAKKYTTKSEWMRENVSSYNTALKNNVLFELCTSLMKNDVEFGKVIYTFDVCKEAYDKYESMKEIIEKEKPAYNAAIRNGWNEELSKNKEKYSQHKSTKWTFEKIKNEASKYNSIKEFANANRSAYYKAIYSKWLLHVIDHMDGGYKKWTLDKIVDVLKKYDKNEWYKIKECKAPIAYIKRHNLQDALEKKMKQRGV